VLLLLGQLQWEIREMKKIFTKKFKPIQAILFGLLFVVILISLLMITKPAYAIAPFSSKVWLGQWLQILPGTSDMVTVTVTWPEGAGTGKVELKTQFKN